MADYSYGLLVNGVKIGALAADGGPSTTLTSPGKVLKDTIEVNPATDTDTEFTAQGESNPFLIVSEAGVESGTFDLATMDKEVIADLTGGTVGGTGATAYYMRPVGDPPEIYRTLELSPKMGDKWIFPRVKISAKLVGRFRNTELNVLRVSFTTMQPLKDGVGPFYLGVVPAL